MRRSRGDDALLTMTDTDRWTAGIRNVRKSAQRKGLQGCRGGFLPPSSGPSPGARRHPCLFGKCQRSAFCWLRYKRLPNNNDIATATQHFLPSCSPAPKQLYPHIWDGELSNQICLNNTVFDGQADANQHPNTLKRRISLSGHNPTILFPLSVISCRFYKKALSGLESEKNI